MAIAPKAAWFSKRSAIAGFALLGSLGLIFLCLLGLHYYVQSLHVPRIRLSAGPDSTRRFEVAQYLCQQINKKNADVQLVTNEGSEACLNLVKSGQLDAAIVSSGVKIPDDDSITVLGVLQLEAVHVLVRPGLADNIPLSKAIIGKRVNLGVRGSTEWLLAREFLSFARLRLPTETVPGDVVPTEYSKNLLKEKCESIMLARTDQRDRMIAELPDCLLILGTMPSSIAQLLMETAGYELRSMPATRAFLLDRLQNNYATHTILEREFLEPTVILSHSYFTQQAYPETDCETVGVRLLLVARSNLTAMQIQPLMKAMFESEFTHRAMPQSPIGMAGPYAVHPAAVAYFDRDKPYFLAQQAMEWLANGLSFLGAFSAGALSLYGIIRKKKHRTPSDYLSEIRNINDAIHKTESHGINTSTTQQISKQLDEQLQLLRQNMIDDVCAGRMKADQSFSNILQLLKDTRCDLAIPTPHAESHPPHTDSSPTRVAPSPARAILRRREPPQAA